MNHEHLQRPNTTRFTIGRTERAAQLGRLSERLAPVASSPRSKVRVRFLLKVLAAGRCQQSQPDTSRMYVRSLGHFNRDWLAKIVHQSHRVVPEGDARREWLHRCRAISRDDRRYFFRPHRLQKAANHNFPLLATEVVDANRRTLTLPRHRGNGHKAQPNSVRLRPSPPPLVLRARMAASLARVGSYRGR